MDAYEKTALAYDLIQEARGRSYTDHVEHIARLAPNGTSLLDVACGTGFHLAGFREHFRTVAGIDLSPAMLQRATAVVPDVPLVVGDMRTFAVDAQFDVVTCLFSSIGYMLTIDDVRIAIGNMGSHVAPGGLLIVEPWLQPHMWKVPYVVAESANSDGVAIGRVSTNGQDGHISTFTLHWTIATAEGVDYVVEEHALGLYEIGDYTTAFEAAGFDVDYDPVGLIGRGLLVGRKN